MIIDKFEKMEEGGVLKTWNIIDPNLNTDKIIMKPTFPLPLSTFEKIKELFTKAVNESKINQKEPDAFRCVLFNTSNSLFIHAIVDNKKETVEFLLSNNKNVNLNIAVFDRKLNYIGRPLDFAVNSLTDAKGVDMLMSLMLKGARSDHESELVNKLIKRASYATDPNFQFKTLMAKNLLQIIKGDFSEKNILSRVAFEKAKIFLKKNELEAILPNLDKISADKKQQLLKQINSAKLKTPKEILEYYNVADNLKVPRQGDYPNYQVLTNISQDPTLKDFPMHQKYFYFDDIEKLSAELSSLTLSGKPVKDMWINETIKEFLILQTISDINQLDSFDLDKEIISDKKDYDLIEDHTLEEVRKNIAQLRRNNLYVYKNLPERNTENIEKNSLLDEYEFNKVKQEIEKEASLNRKEEGKLKKFFKKILN